MEDTSTRVLAAAALLAVIWIVVYWLWQPGTPATTFAAREPTHPSAAADVARDGPPPPPAAEAPDQTPIIDPLAERRDQQPQATSEEPQAKSPERVGGVQPPRFREYVIKPGDTFQRIAQREYGSAARWPVVARANPLTDPVKIRPGDVIRLPLDPSNIQGRPVDPPQRNDSPSDQDADEPVIEYRVRPGDTLSEIAARFYGSVRHTDFLYQSNRARLRAKNALRAGQTIRIPPRPPSE